MLRSARPAGPAPYHVTVARTFTIAAPVEMVFRYFKAYKHFPDYLSNVLSVEDEGQGRLLWTIAVPGGEPIRSRSVVTTLLRNEEIAWQSELGSQPAHEGRLTFRPVEGGAEVSFRLSYSPDADGRGLLGPNPREEVGAHVARIQEMLEKKARKKLEKAQADRSAPRA